MTPWACFCITGIVIVILAETNSRYLKILEQRVADLNADLLRMERLQLDHIANLGCELEELRETKAAD